MLRGHSHSAPAVGRRGAYLGSNAPPEGTCCHDRTTRRKLHGRPLFPPPRSFPPSQGRAGPYHSQVTGGEGGIGCAGWRSSAAQRRGGLYHCSGKGGETGERGRAGWAVRRERACAGTPPTPPPSPPRRPPPLRHRRAWGDMSTCSVSKVRSGRERGVSPGNSAACAGAGPAASSAASCACSSSRLLQPLPFPPPWCPGSRLPCSAARRFPKPCWLFIQARFRLVQDTVRSHRGPRESRSILGWKGPTRTIESTRSLVQRSTRTLIPA